MEKSEIANEIFVGCEKANSLHNFSEVELRALKIYQRKGIFGLGQDFERGSWSVPKLDTFMSKLFNLQRSKWSALRRPLVKLLAKDILWNLQSPQRAYRVAEQHYDLGNDLFAEMLDQSMTYTCGYWKQAQTLEQAQEAKLKLCCDKLQLKPGMRVLDIGCGWGNFAEFAAKYYGTSVVGLTVSKEQAAFATKRCNGLAVQILLQDYREMRGQFDRIVSIEMIEAVGRKNLGTFFQVASRNLTADGLFLLQAISADSFSRTSSAALDEFLVWLIKYIFPNGYLPKISDLSNTTQAGLRIEHLEQFGADYDRTLLAWHSNFESGWDKIKDHYGEAFRRRWSFYLLTSAAVFRTKKVELYQVLYSKQR